MPKIKKNKKNEEKPKKISNNREYALSLKYYTGNIWSS